MYIELTKDQYKTLLKLMYCGEWVLNSYKTSEDKVYKETYEFNQYMYAFAKEVNLEKLIEYDDMNNMYFPTDLMEDSFHKYIDKYDARQRG